MAGKNGFTVEEKQLQAQLWALVKAAFAEGGMKKIKPGSSVMFEGKAGAGLPKAEIVVDEVGDQPEQIVVYLDHTPSDGFFRHVLYLTSKGTPQRYYNDYEEASYHVGDGSDDPHKQHVKAHPYRSDEVMNQLENRFIPALESHVKGTPFKNVLDTQETPQGKGAQAELHMDQPVESAVSHKPVAAAVAAASFGYDESGEQLGLTLVFQVGEKALTKRFMADPDDSNAMASVIQKVADLLKYGHAHKLAQLTGKPAMIVVNGDDVTKIRLGKKGDTKTHGENAAQISETSKETANHLMDGLTPLLKKVLGPDTPLSLDHMPDPAQLAKALGKAAKAVHGGDVIAQPGNFTSGTGNPVYHAIAKAERAPWDFKVKLGEAIMNCAININHRAKYGKAMKPAVVETVDKLNTYLQTVQEQRKDSWTEGEESVWKAYSLDVLDLKWTLDYNVNDPDHLVQTFHGPTKTPRKDFGIRLLTGKVLTSLKQAPTVDKQFAEEKALSDSLMNVQRTKWDSEHQIGEKLRKYAISINDRVTKAHAGEVSVLQDKTMVKIKESLDNLYQYLDKRSAVMIDAQMNSGPEWEVTEGYLTDALDLLTTIKYNEDRLDVPEEISKTFAGEHGPTAVRKDFGVRYLKS